MKLGRIAIYVAAAAVAAGMSLVALRDGRALDGYASEIASEQREKEAVARGRIEHQQKIEEISREMEALPDSLARAARMGIAMKKSQKLAKGLYVLDNRELRANNMIKAVEKRRARTLAHRRRWMWCLGAALAALAGGLVVLRRMAP
ncbi:MAG: hypothetical protein ACE5EO_04740 [Candidatus Krumholzibacteriia bacterium]